MEARRAKLGLEEAGRRGGTSSRRGSGLPGPGGIHAVSEIGGSHPLEGIQRGPRPGSFEHWQAAYPSDVRRSSLRGSDLAMSLMPIVSLLYLNSAGVKAAFGMKDPPPAA